MNRSPIRNVARALWRTWREPPGQIQRRFFVPSAEGLVLRGTQFTWRQAHAHPMIRAGAEYIVKMCEAGGAQVTTVDDLLTVQIAGITLEVTTVEELFIINEVYVDRCYDLCINRRCAVLDIGMNVAFTSLRFASRPETAAVYSFEPFAPTYQQALRNIALNECGAKITPQNVGLGANAMSFEAAYDPSSRGRSKTAPKGNEQSRMETIHIASVESAVGVILQQSGGLPLIAKIDCEGAEYEIIPSLALCGAFDRIEAMAIEWHHRGPDELLKVLLQHGYRTLTTAPDAPHAGMIYGFR